MSINKVIMTGRLTADPELRKTQDGVSVTAFSLAINKSKDKAEFFNFVAWRATAEFICKYFHKGDGMEVVGKLTYRTVEKDGVKRTFYEIICEDVGFAVGGRKEPKNEAPQFTTADTTHFEELADDEGLPW